MKKISAVEGVVQHSSSRGCLEELAKETVRRMESLDVEKLSGSQVTFLVARTNAFLSVFEKFNQ